MTPSLADTCRSTHWLRRRGVATSTAHLTPLADKTRPASRTAHQKGATTADHPRSLRSLARYRAGISTADFPRTFLRQTTAVATVILAGGRQWGAAAGLALDSDLRGSQACGIALPGRPLTATLMNRCATIASRSAR